MGGRGRARWWGANTGGLVAFSPHIPPPRRPLVEVARDVRYAQLVGDHRARDGVDKLQRAADAAEVEPGTTSAATSLPFRR